MGYDQFLSVTFRKDGLDGKAIKMIAALTCPDFIKAIEDYAPDYDETDGSRWRLEWSWGNRNVYDGNILEKFDPGQLSQILDCFIEIHYEGEERYDAENVQYRSGAKIRRQVPDWVDAD